MNADKWILQKREYIAETYCELGEIWPILGYVQNYCFSADDCDDEKSPNEWIDCDVGLNDHNAVVSEYVNAPNYALRHRRSALEFVAVYNSFDTLKSSCYLMKNVQLPYGYLCVYILYVLRIESVESGIYLLFPKHAKKHEQIWKKRNSKTITLIDRSDGDDDGLVIYQYKAMELEQLAKMSKEMACHQNLCFNAAFTIDFCVDLEVAVSDGYKYNARHWESGYIGQLLYVHMESIGLGATAIVCYLDDYASANVGFLPTPKRSDEKKEISPDDLNRFDDFEHPFKNIRSLCHFSCGTPSEDLRYPYFAWDSELFPFDQSSE